ncbi:MAG: hypothetical protein J2P50_08355 [Hyphomicrobiaceae bacterium]|nr:hypothetical protein [Hyphomicrobiaceae bacterium]
MLTVRFTRVSPTHHRFEVERADGSKQAAIIETRSGLVHDLLHFAFETEAGLTRSFYGLIAAGRTLAETRPRPSADGPSFPTAEARLTERMVGILTVLVEDKFGASEALAGLRRLQQAHAEPMPEWLTEDLIRRTAEHFRRLHGKWKSTPFGDTMELRINESLHAAKPTPSALTAP